MNTNTLNFLKIFSKEFQIFSYKTSQILSLCIATVIYIWMKHISPSGILRMKFKHNGPCFFVNKNRFIMLICSPEWGTLVLTQGPEWDQLYGSWYIGVDVTPDHAAAGPGPAAGDNRAALHCESQRSAHQMVQTCKQCLTMIEVKMESTILKKGSTHQRFHTESIKTQLGRVLKQVVFIWNWNVR